jgi:hypothetical protein
MLVWMIHVLVAGAGVVLLLSCTSSERPADPASSGGSSGAGGAGTASTDGGTLGKASGGAATATGGAASTVSSGGKLPSDGGSSGDGPTSGGSAGALVTGGGSAGTAGSASGGRPASSGGRAAATGGSPAASAGASAISCDLSSLTTSNNEAGIGAGCTYTSEAREFGACGANFCISRPLSDRWPPGQGFCSKYCESSTECGSGFECCEARAGAFCLTFSDHPMLGSGCSERCATNHLGCSDEEICCERLGKVCVLGNCDGVCL